MQSVADGYTAIIGHGGEKETFSGTKKRRLKKIHLDEAIQVWGILVGSQLVV